MGGGHIRYSRTVQYGTSRMYAEEPPVRDAPGRYSPLPESFISDTNNSIHIDRPLTSATVGGTVGGDVYMIDVQHST